MENLLPFTLLYLAAQFPRAKQMIEDLGMECEVMLISYPFGMFFHFTDAPTAFAFSALLDPNF